MSNYEERPEFIFDDIQIIRANRQPCIVCGNKTGDCTVDGAEPKHIIGIGLFSSLDKKTTILVEEDIFEERQITPYHKNTVMLARKGSYISVEKAKELGLL
jgi:hypothetical protein